MRRLPAAGGVPRRAAALRVPDAPLAARGAPREAQDAGEAAEAAAEPDTLSPHNVRAPTCMQTVRASAECVKSLNVCADLRFLLAPTAFAK